MIILDTNVLSALMRTKPDAEVTAWLDQQPAQSVWITAITMFEARFGIAHMGFLVNDSKATAQAVAAGGATVKARPAHRTQSEIRMRDPEGNGCDLSQRGWEVDTDKWVRATAA